MELSRRSFVKLAGGVAVGIALGDLGGGKMAKAAGQAPVVGSKNVTGVETAGSRAKVYFTKHIDAEHLIALYHQMA